MNSLDYLYKMHNSKNYGHLFTSLIAPAQCFGNTRLSPDVVLIYVQVTLFHHYFDQVAFLKSGNETLRNKQNESF